MVLSTALSTALSILATLLILAAGCQRRPAPPAPALPVRPLRIAMIAKSASNPSFLSSRLGAEDRARKLAGAWGRAIQVEWLTPPREDAARQVERIRQAVAEDADAILISCSDADAVTPAIDEAVARGVAVMTFDSDAPRSRRFTHAGVDDLKAGQALMRELAALLPEAGRTAGKVAVLAGNPTAPNLRRRVEGIQQEAARHPRLSVLGPFFTVETPQDAVAAVMRAEAAHPDIAGWAMVGGWPLYTQTLLHDLESRARRRLPKIVSINALPAQLVYVQHGVAPVLLAQPTYSWGEVGVQAIADKLLLGRAVPDRIPMELVRVTRQTLPDWVRQLRAWGFVDAPEEYLNLNGR